jgi:hypothetical protein
MEKSEKVNYYKLLWGTLIVGGSIFAGWLLKDNPDIFNSVIETIKELINHAFV